MAKTDIVVTMVTVFEGVSCPYVMGGQRAPRARQAKNPHLSGAMCRIVRSAPRTSYTDS